MALKILSGLIAPDAGHRTEGSATINFEPYSVSGDVIPAVEDDFQQCGPSGRYTGEPCKVTSLRQIQHPGKTEAAWFVSDQFTNPSRRDGLQVLWKTDDNGEIHAISYMIIGEVSEAEVPEPRPLSPPR